MRRIATLGTVAIISVFAANPIHVHAEPTLVSAWQHCEQGNGCAKFAFMPNGRVIEQFRASGNIVTAYGRYHIRGTVLKINWKQFVPAQVCGRNLSNGGSASDQCLSTTQSDFKGPFHFEGLNALLWLKTDKSPLRLLRIQL